MQHNYTHTQRQTITSIMQHNYCQISLTTKKNKFSRKIYACDAKINNNNNNI